MCVYVYAERDVSRLTVPLTDWFSATSSQGVRKLSIYLSVYVYLPIYLSMCIYVYTEKRCIPAGGLVDRLVLSKPLRKVYGNYQYINLSVCLSIYLSIYLSMCIYEYTEKRCIPAGGPADRLVLSKPPRKG